MGICSSEAEVIVPRSYSDGTPARGLAQLGARVKPGFKVYEAHSMSSISFLTPQLFHKIKASHIVGI